MSAGPLADLRVVEVGGVVGEWCGKLLGDMGADVIKVEPPDGAAERSIGPFYRDEPHAERSLHFWHYNASKRGVTLDLDHPAARELFRSLLATADVLLDSLPVGTLDALGLGFEELHALNARLVVCALTPFGQHGPWRDYRSTDLTALAAGGQMASCGYDEADVPDAPPIAPGGGNAWHTAGHLGVIAIMAALVQRDATGVGQFVDCSAHAALALTTEMAASNYIYTGGVVRRQTGRHHALSPMPPLQYRCWDGVYLNASQNLRPGPMRALIEWMNEQGMAQDLTDARYADPKVIEAERAHIQEVLARFLGSITAEEAYHGGQARGFPWGPVRAPEEVLRDEHFHATGYWAQLEHPELGATFTYPGVPMRFSAAPAAVTRRAPMLGEHTAEVLAELGVPPERLTLLREAGAV